MLQNNLVRRSAERTKTKFTALARCQGGESRGTVLDLSATGMCFQLYFDINAKEGQPITLESEELGHLTGMIQWSRGDKIGIRLKLSTNTAAQIASYFKFFNGTGTP
ncbi:PilZ domain-containing protein [Rhizobium sp. CFBP 8762]|uniref:PilZ domain-containing protein n=1 Tax=Rhizobium sp. CFBP 8762 TaxID=2775279 RepID=UPI00177D67C7|nr:PilZ domain-containing protein [Rhizobium sp. CFBP 8762]MBD8554696.1 PilZ domain-containing protein [Rhizobium sp. CFBP 8762]